MKIIREQAEEPTGEVSPEMGADMPVDATDEAEISEDEPTPLTSEGERYLVELLVKAFLHEPDTSEKNIVKELQVSVLDENPKEVADAISNFLEISSASTQEDLDDITDIEPRM